MKDELDYKVLPRALVLAITVLLPFGMGVRQCERVVIGQHCDADGGTGQNCGCDYDGEHHASGEGFKSADGCNDCSCQADGTVVCTLRACVPTTKACGGIAGLQCADGEYCDFAPDANCGAADRTGTCKTKPELCPALVAPVCGCDDQTYNNGCEAQRAGVSVASDGMCTAAADGCDYDGAHHAVGDSYPASDGCNTCSCQQDGSSACTEKACSGGGACGSRGLPACADGQYCKFDPQAQCGRADAPGTCSPVTPNCTKDYRPVCGCDGTTYGNACTAGAAGVSVDYSGECKSGCDYNGRHYDAGATFKSTDGCNSCSCDGPTGEAVCTLIGCVTQSCGGLTGASCPGGQYCDYPSDALCGAADATGTCQPIPDVCDDLYAPVCGCDDKTYPNACGAAAAGISARAYGECPAAGGCDYDGTHYASGASFPASDGCNNCSCNDNGMVACTLKACVPNKTCGGIAGIQCAADEYCNYTMDANCGIADASGTCMPRPQVCTDIYAPVCGCDNKTYGSACSAQSSGVSPRSTGACQ